MAKLFVAFAVLAVAVSTGKFLFFFASKNSYKSQS